MNVWLHKNESRKETASFRKFLWECSFSYIVHLEKENAGVVIGLNIERIVEIHVAYIHGKFN